jgi:DNA adenine methylase
MVLAALSRVRAPRPPDAAAKPFLKWAGGKRQLLAQLRPYYPAQFGAYVEPFLGSAAVFFDLYSRGLTDGHDVRLSDSSDDLITCYRAVRENVEQVIDELQTLEDGHRSRGKPHYYEVRDGRFNPLRRQLRAAGCSPDGNDRKRVALAAMLIYLNRTGYNGLFRLNASGDFNVPMGRYDRPRICDPSTLRSVSAALRSPGVSIELCSFADALAVATPGDFVYLDPPYAPLTRTARFTAYTAGGFDSEDQRRLREAVVELAARGVRVVLSNSVADEVRALYADDQGVRRAGLRTLLVPARRAINSRGTRRGPVYEYVITNVGC